MSWQWYLSSRIGPPVCRTCSVCCQYCTAAGIKSFWTTAPVKHKTTTMAICVTKTVSVAIMHRTVAKYFTRHCENVFSSPTVIMCSCKGSGYSWILNDNFIRNLLLCLTLFKLLKISPKFLVQSHFFHPRWLRDMSLQTSINYHQIITCILTAHSTL